MAEFSRNLRNQLSEFLLNEIQSKALDGITYAMLSKDQKDREDYERYMTIRKEADMCGYDQDQVFRVFELNNGYIFDMDLSTAESILSALSKPLINSEGVKGNIFDVMGSRPAEHRAKDMKLLADYIKSEANKGNTEITVALYNRNSTNKVMISGKTMDNKPVTIIYKAYAVRHWDLGQLNSKLLIPNGLRVSKVQPCEVLPSKTGVSFILTISNV